MRKKIISLSIAITLLLCTILHTSITVKAAEDELYRYRETLEKINEELGTHYSFPTQEQLKAENKSYNDLINFYTSMGINDFIKYVKKAYRNERLGIYSRLNYAQNMEDSISTVAYDKIQRFYYDSKWNNCFYIDSTLYSADGKERYASINHYGYNNSTYPCYKPTSMTHSKSSDCTEVTCIFKCVKYVAKNLIEGVTCTLKVTFRASSGNVYATTTA